MTQTNVQDYLNLADPDLETDTGWVDPRGNFYPCEYCGHNDLFQEMRDAGYAPDLEHNRAEDTLVKFSGGQVLMFGRAMSPRQRLTVEQIIEKHWPTSKDVYQCGQYEFWLESGKAKSRLI